MNTNRSVKTSTLSARTVDAVIYGLYRTATGEAPVLGHHYSVAERRSIVVLLERIVDKNWGGEFGVSEWVLGMLADLDVAVHLEGSAGVA